MQIEINKSKLIYKTASKVSLGAPWEDRLLLSFVKTIQFPLIHIAELSDHIPIFYYILFNNLIINILSIPHLR